MSANGKIKRNIEKARGRVKKLKAQLEQDQEKHDREEDGLEKLSQIVRDIQKQNADLLAKNERSKEEYENQRRQEKKQLEEKLKKKNKELRDLKENIEELNRKADEENAALEEYQKSISFQCTKYNQEIQRAKNEVIKLSSELKHYENPQDVAGSENMMTKLLNQIHQREKKEKLSRQIDTLTSLRDNLQNEIQDLERKIEEAAKKQTDQGTENKPENPQ